jgi:hypothetical protein
MTLDDIDEPPRYTLDQVREAYISALAWVKQGLAGAHGPGCSGHEELERILDHMAELACYTLALRPGGRKP